MSTTAPTTGNWDGRTTFLSLPPELRQTIYDLAQPGRYLNTTPFDEIGPTFLTSSPQRFPSLFLTTHRIYLEAAPIFYSKATLHLPVPLLHLPHSASTQQRTSRAISLLPQHLKDALRTVKLYTDHLEDNPAPTSWPIAYQAVLCWLARNTGVTSVTINRPLMVHACKRLAMRSEEGATLLRLMSSQSDRDTRIENTAKTHMKRRTIKIFSTNDREFWEGRCMGAGRGTIVAEQAPSLRMSVYLHDSSTSLVCDPRGSANWQKGLAADGKAIGDMMDVLRERDPGLRDEEVQQTADDGTWLFQVVFVR